jgi:hypothetical protein
MMNKSKKIEPFNYGNITQEHKKAIEEVIVLAENAGHPLFADLLKNKFQIIERKKFNVDDSIFIKYAKENNIYCSAQGFIDNLNPEDPMIPVIGLCEDVKKLDNFVLKIQENTIKSILPKK